MTDQWVDSWMALKRMAAGIGRAIFRNARPTAPSPITMRASHSGVASSITGGMMKVSSMCWTMWTEYRYSSAMSCMGQSAAIHSMTMPRVNQRFCAAVTTGSPAGTETRSERLQRVDVQADQADQEHPHLRVRLPTEVVGFGPDLGQQVHGPSLRRRVSPAPFAGRSFPASVLARRKDRCHTIPVVREVDLVGRDELVAGLVEAVCHGGSVLLAGPAGVGKTRVVREALATPLIRRRHVERFVATESSRHIPLAPFISLLDEAGAGDLTQLLAGVRARLLAYADDRPLVVAVDDAHLLDDSSITLVVELINRGDAAVVLTARTGDEIPHSITSMWTSGTVDRIEIADLDQADATTLTEALLSGPTDDSLAGAVFGASGGNPLLIRELVLDGVASGAIAEADGSWCLEHPLSPGARLHEVVGARTGRLDADVLRVLEMVSLGEPLDTAIFSDDEGRALDELERLGFVRLEQTADALLARCDHPLVGETIRSGVSTRRAVGHHRTLAERLSELSELRAGDALRIARWWAAAGTSPPPTTALAAAREALRSLDLDQADHLATLALVHSDSFEAHLILGEVRRFRRRSSEADDCYARAQALAPDDEALGVATHHRAWIHIHQLGDPARAIELLEGAASQVTEATTRLDLERAAANFSGMFGRYHDVKRANERLLETPGLDGGSRNAALGNLVYAQVMLGELPQVEERLDAMDASSDQPDLDDLTWALRCGVAIQRGDLVGGEQRTAEHIEACRRSDLVHGAAATMFVQLLSYRSSPELLPAVDHTLTELTRADPFGVLPMALGIAACARAQAGRADEAIDALEQVGDDLTDVRALPFVGRGRASVLALTGDIDRAVETAVESGREALSTSHVAFALTALHDATRFGGAALVADEMMAAAVDPEAHLLRAFAADAEAMRDGDGKSVLLAATSFAGLGAPALAADAAARATDLLDPSSETARQAHAVSKLLSRQTGDLLVRAPAEIPDQLSDRELDVASIAAEGTASRDIAAALYLSVRTVDNHLRRVYRKLAVDGRQDLAEVLAPAR